MAIEIERKFLVLGNRWRSEVLHSLVMRQGYLSESGKASVRVRVEGEVAKLNLKSRSKGAQRLEFEYDIPNKDAAHMLQELAGAKVHKTRHHIAHEGLIIEVDEFAGDNTGLVVAEVELDAIDQGFSKPVWLGRELTDEHRYYNTELARTPFSQWPDREAILNEMAGH